jgi:hypothetical protein
MFPCSPGNMIWSKRMSESIYYSMMKGGEHGELGNKWVFCHIIGYLTVPQDVPQEETFIKKSVCTHTL